MRTTPPAWAPLCKLSDVEIEAYKNSAHGKLQAWLAFEDDYRTSLKEERLGL
jgi:hypothetical protein